MGAEGSLTRVSGREAHRQISCPFSEFRSLVDLLRWRARCQPTGLAYAFLADGETEESRLTFADLDRRARAIAAGLGSVAEAGDRVLLLYPQGLAYLTAFFGCLYAGLVAVPSFPPRLNRSDPRLGAIVADSDARVALTTSRFLSNVERRFAHMPELESLHWLDTATILDDAAGEWQDPGVGEETLAFLQYTSGSTATPKGVMVCHRNLLCNLEMLRTAFDQSARSLFVSWLPLFHDMGLIVMALHSAYVGAGCVLMAPPDVVQRPFRWLDAISRYGGTTSGGPNFAFDLCVRRIAPEQREMLDLSSWTLAVNGSEPVRHETLERFAGAFAPCGLRREALYPAYGLAEATVFVSGGIKTEPPVVRSLSGAGLEERCVAAPSTGEEDARMLVGCGQTWLDQEIAIVDPESLVRCPPGRIGEIWISGPNVARGYWNRPCATEETFRAHLADTGEGPFLRTGDLGFLLDDELFIAGRIKDLIIVRGLNHYPQDIELTAERGHPALREGCGAAFSIDAAGSERLVIVYELERGHRDADVSEVCDAVRRAVAADHELQVHTIVLIRTGSVPKTSSGKIQRSACRARFLEGGLKVIGSSVLDSGSAPVESEGGLTRDVLLATDVRDRRPLLDSFLQRLVARVLGVAPALVEPERSLVTLGIDSLMAVELRNSVEAHLGVELPAVDFVGGLDVARLASEVLDDLAAGDGRRLLPPIEPASREESLPLSFEQERLWFLDRLVLPGNPAYHVTAAFFLKGHLDVGALEQALGEIVRRHEILRTAFPSVDGLPLLRVAPLAPLELEKEDLCGLPEDEREIRARRLATGQVRRSFDLAQSPLMRASLLRLGDEEHVVVLTLHHVVSDAWSLNVLVRELAALYEASAAGKPSPLAELPVQYADFAAWQRRWMQGEVLENGLAYWRRQLAGAPQEPLLSTDYPRPPVRAYRGEHEFFDLSPDLVASLRELGRRDGATLFMVLLAAFKAVLHRLSGREDICLGCPTVGRARPETEPLIGFFAYPLVLRTDASGDPTFRDLLARVRRVALGAYAHRHVPYSMVMRVAAHERSAGHNPVFQVMFSMTRSPLDGVAISGLEIGLFDVESEATDFDLFLTVMEDGERLHGMLGYDADLFAASTVQRLIAVFRRALHQFAGRPELRLSELDVPPEIEAVAATGDVRAGEQTIAIAATFTAEPLADALAYWMGELGVPSRITFAPYNQVFQQLLDPSSLLAGNGRGVNVVLVRFEDWQRFEAPATEPGEAGVERNVRDLVAALEDAATRSTLPFVVCVCPAAPGTDAGRTALFERMEMLVASAAGAIGGVYLVATSELLALYPVREYHDPYGDEVGHVPYTDAFFTALATTIARKIDAIQRAPFKVIVLDCDQTLWKGVCGEDGPLGVEVDPPREALQQFMVAQHEAGMLICLCSKNRAEDVFEVFDRCPGMVLERDHVVAWRINWKPKSENLQSLAQELGLGLDSFILVDDNPVECAEVRANCPQALVLELPQEAEDVPRFLRHVWAFDHVETTEEDRRRAAFYRQNAARERFRADTLTFDDFIDGLDLHVVISEMTPGQLGRVAQLTQRTNQFNATSVRRTEGQVQQLARSGAELLTVEVRDRFGDYGIVGVMAYETRPGALWVDTFLLSCRALGRGVEHRMLAGLGQAARSRGLGCVVIPCLPTERNRPLLDFMDDVGIDYKESEPERYLYRIPAEVAATLSYRASVRRRNRRFDDRRSG
jgi:FkbH-like protein